MPLAFPSNYLAFMTSKKHLARKDFLIANVLIAGYSLFLFLFSQEMALSNPYWINDDWPQHHLWLYQYQANFFQTDDFYLLAAEAIQPWGVTIVNRLLASFFPPLTISKIFPLFTLYATCWFSFFLIKRRLGWAFAIAAMVLMSNIPFERMIGFFARAYAFPLLLAFLYCWVEEKKKAVLAVVFLSSLFYPVIFLLEGGIMGISFAIALLEKKVAQNARWYLGQLVVLLCCCCLLLWKSYRIEHNPVLGGFLSKTELLERPEFGPGGRVSFQYNMNIDLPLRFSWKSYFPLPTGGYGIVLVASLLLILISLLLLRKSEHKRLDITIVSLFVSGTVLFYLAQWRLPQLFLPERYLYYSYLPFLFLLVLRSFSFLRSLIRKPLFLDISVMAILIFAAFYQKSPKDIGLYGYDEHRSLYEQINTFKRPVMIAGPPIITSQIPTFCRQSVLFSQEAAHAIYFKNYYDYVKPRVDDFVDAYTSDKLEDLRDFIGKYDIDYLIIDKKFLSSKEIWFYEPYRGIIRKKLKEVDPTSLALTQIPPAFIIKVDERYDLLDGKALLSSEAILK
jgi:uncharacterized membrane protein